MSAEATTIPVRAGGGRSDYEVLVGAGLLHELPALLRERAPAHRYAVVSDETVAPLYAAPLVQTLGDGPGGADLVTFPAGERHKNRQTWSRLTDRLLTLGHGRDSAVVAVGGGVTGDLAGFVAASFMRGVPVVQVPTSTVAMIDAAVGGKTGVDVPAGKNLVGAFHPPRFVAVDPGTVRSLPRPERAEGLAEAVKHGAILDAAYLDALTASAGELLAGEEGAVRDAVVRSVELKADVVSRDEREGGLREILNFGHTLGHALEAASEYRLSHGRAVALGMVLEGRLGERLGVTAPGTAEAVARAVRLFELPATLADAPAMDALRDVESLLRYTRVDKKGRAGRARYVLLSEPGSVARHGEGWSREVDEAVVAEVLGGALAVA